jgi:hypothetical protein
MVDKPDYIFDRINEWQSLADYVTDDRPGATLGVVSGRRRQGKTLLLESMCEEVGGLYFAVPEDMPTVEHLRRLGDAIAGHTGTPPPRLESWDEGIETLFLLGRERPTPVVLDEFPYMARSTPSLPSIIQHALSPRNKARLASRTRLVLCGSSLSFMNGLVSGTAALYGRARLSLLVQAFDYRTAAEFWGVHHDHRLAALLYAMVGGTPAYIENVSATPRSVADLDDWIPRNLLNATNMLFRQPRMLLSEDSAFKEIGMYGAVLTVVAEGCRTATKIANRLRRSSSDIHHYLKGLVDGGFLRQIDDAFRENRSEYQIVDSLMAFHHAVVYPNWSRLDLYRPERAQQVWREAEPSFRCHVVGPAFERICRAWIEGHAEAATVGGIPATVGQGVINDPAGRSRFQLDVVVRDGRRQIISVGEIKWGETMEMGHVERLNHAIDLLRGQRTIDAGTNPSRLLFGGAGFTDDLREHAAESAGRVQLIDLARLYEGA